MELVRPVFLLCFLLIREGDFKLEIFVELFASKLVMGNRELGGHWQVGCLVFTNGECFVNSLPSLFAINPHCV